MRQFSRTELAIIQSALCGFQQTEAKQLMHEIQSHLLNDQPTSVLTKEFLDKLRATKNGGEWSVLVKGMLANNGGSYPDDWYEKVMASGLTAECERNWNAVSSSYKSPAPNANVPRIDNLAPDADTIIVTTNDTVVTVSRDEDNCIHVVVKHHIETPLECDTERHLVLGIAGDLK